MLDLLAYIAVFAGGLYLGIVIMCLMAMAKGRE